jgi:hypothetical protein
LAGEVFELAAGKVGFFSEVKQNSLPMVFERKMSLWIETRVFDDAFGGYSISFCRLGKKIGFLGF